MRIDFIKEITDSCSTVISTKIVNPSSIDVTYTLSDGRNITYRVYQPSGQEYLLGRDVIDRVHEFNVDVIVGTTYTQVSGAAKGYAETKNINILSSSRQYKFKIANGENIGFK